MGLLRRFRRVHGDGHRQGLGFHFRARLGRGHRLGLRRGLELERLGLRCRGGGDLPRPQRGNGALKSGRRFLARRRDRLRRRGSRGRRCLCLRLGLWRHGRRGRRHLGRRRGHLLGGLFYEFGRNVFGERGVGHLGVRLEHGLRVFELQHLDLRNLGDFENRLVIVLDKLQTAKLGREVEDLLLLARRSFAAAAQDARDVVDDLIVGLALKTLVFGLRLFGRLLSRGLTGFVVCDDPTDGGKNFLHGRLRSALGAAHDLIPRRLFELTSPSGVHQGHSLNNLTRC